MLVAPPVTPWFKSAALISRSAKALRVPPMSTPAYQPGRADICAWAAPEANTRAAAAIAFLFTTPPALEAQLYADLSNLAFPTHSFSHPGATRTRIDLLPSPSKGGAMNGL